MIQDLLGSVASIQAYTRFISQKAGRTFLYLCFISLIFSAAGMIAVNLRLGPAFDETFEWLATETPTLTFSNGKVTSAALGPTRLVHPKMHDFAFLIDTSRVEPVTAQTMAEDKVFAHLTGNALYVKKEQGRMEVYDLSKAALDRPMVVDANFFREAKGKIKSFFFPIAAVGMFVFSVAWTSLTSLFYSVLGMIFNSFAKGNLGFGSLYKLAVHAQTTAILLRAIIAFVPFPLPLIGLLLILTTSVYLWLAVRANATPAPAVAA